MYRHNTVNGLPRTAFAVLFLCGTISAEADTPSAEPLPDDGRVAASSPAQFALPSGKSGRAHAVTIRLKTPTAAQTEKLADAGNRLRVRVLRDGRAITKKFLHAGDPDLFVLVRADGEEKTVLEIGGEGETVPAYEADVRLIEARRNESEAELPLIETEPNDTAEQAFPFNLGQTVFASADDRPFIAAPGQDDEQAKQAGVDWYTVEHTGEKPVLAFFWIDFLDREVPVDVAVFHRQDGELKRYDDDFERFVPERSTNYAGLYKFVARRLKPGRYFLRVKAHHPAYQLRSETYPVPPYDPEQEGGLRPAAEKAMRVAQDYIILKGESWHANTPRVGGVDNRIRNVHAETAQCIACHPTHFATRGAVFNIANGYPVRRREGLKFLTERLYNNPRPFYGHSDAHWARMISAAGNVVSRLSIMLQVHEETVSGRPRTGVHRDVAEYLKLYYKDRDKLPGDESNGNRPIVSNFEVATHSWMVFDELHERTGKQEYAEWRDKVRKLIESGDDQIKDMLDLCYQTIAFCRIDPEAYAERIDENVRRIFKHQRKDGQWPMRFGEDEPSAEFQTGHCLYTLALAGVPADDPRVRKAMRYLLAHQKPFGAWYDDDDPDDPHPYENFQTPFRETQFALMAFSEYFPGPAKKDRVAGVERSDPPERAQAGGALRSTPATPGWQAGYETPPEKLAEKPTAKLLEQLDRTWVANGNDFQEQVVAKLEHPHALVRQAAAACLGRIGNEQAVEPLTKALGDRRKLVRRAAAWALRQLGNRGLAHEAVAQALESDDPWTRRGAMQVFAQHARYWVDNDNITRTLIEERMRDSDPWVRMLACRSLWQWWYWTPETAVKSDIEDAYLARMAEERHPWVRKNLIDGFYNVCDENIRYLYNNWISRLGTAELRQTAKDGEHATRNRQAQKVARVLREGNERQVETVLEAISFFHLRSGTYARRGRFSRIGNDVRTIQFYKEAAPELKTALKPYLTSEKAELRGPALLAGYTLRGTGSADVFGLPYLRSLADSDDYTRGVAVEFYENFLPPVNEQTEPQILATLGKLLDSEHTKARRAALNVIGRLKFSKDGRKQLAQTVRDYLAEADESLLPRALEAVAGLPSLWEEPKVILTVAKSLGSENEDVRRAAVKLTLQTDPLAGTTVLRAALDKVFESGDPATRKMLLKLARTEEDLRAHPRVARLVETALAEGDDDVQRMALDLVRRSEELQGNAAVRAALAKLLEDPDERTRQIAQSVYSGKQLPLENVDPSKYLDYQYFKEKVQPIFFAEGPDGQACYQCHHNHGILKLTGPQDGKLSEEITRQNYRSALRVVNLAQPEKSLLLRKPLGTSEAEGTVGGDAVPHGGERRWPEGEASEAYQKILNWLNGAKLEETAAAGK